MEPSMITIRKSEDRGHFDHGWLKTFHTFSFADYMDPDHMGFSSLRVINQDWIRPGEGFGTHGHRDMEIITWVLEGVLEHQDSMGNGSQIRPGELQFMSAGSGVTHSEFNGSADETTQLLQMWVLPAKQGTVPRYDQKKFDGAERRGKLRLVVSPDGKEGSVVIGQDASLLAGSFDAGESDSHPLAPGRSAWLHVARGKVKLNGKELSPGDGAAIRDERELTIEGVAKGEVVLFDLP
jgi:hypothetical protein